MIEDRPIDNLKSNPMQEVFFPRDNGQYEELKRNIEENGLREPIQALPNGIIVAGHQRRQALLDLGQSKVRVEVIQVSDVAARVLFIDSNLCRNQLTESQQFFASYGREAILRDLDPESFDVELAQNVAAKFKSARNMSKRNINRYLQVLRLPAAIRGAHFRKEIRLVDAAKIATLDEAAQGRIVDEIRAGADLKRVVTEAIRSHKTAPRCQGMPARKKTSASMATRILKLFGGLPETEMRTLLDCLSKIVDARLRDGSKPQVKARDYRLHGPQAVRAD
jgi:hypothetical protein